MNGSDISHICEALVAVFTFLNTWMIMRNNRMTQQSKVISEGNAAKLDAASIKLDHVHTCVEVKAEEIKSVVTDAAGIAVEAANAAPPVPTEVHVTVTKEAVP